MSKLYMAVTADKYELPLDFDESPTQLAKRFGVSINYIYVQIYNRKKRSTKHKTKKGAFRFYSVDVGDLEIE